MGDLLGFGFLSIPLIGAYAMFALGISAIYRASRVLNLAHGAMAMVPAYVFHTLVSSAGLPMLAALPVAVASGALLGVAVELVFVRRLRPQGATAQTVGTIAVTGLLVALAAKVWGTSSILAPKVFPEGAVEIAGNAVSYGNLGLFGVGIATSIGMYAFFRFTAYGLAMRGAAQNRTAARLMGVDPDRAASAAWAIGGALAALAGILLAAVTSLDPYTLALQVLPAFVAALIGGLESLVGAMAGAVVVGLAFGLVPAFGDLPVIGGLMRSAGAPQLVLTIVALAVMFFRGRRIVGVEEAGGGFAGGQTFQRLDAKRFTLGLVVMAGLLAVAPWIMSSSMLGSSLRALQYTVIAVSLVLLIGWVGQISLAQATFVGLGAFVTGLAARDAGLGFPLTALFGATAGTLAAVALGAVALRVRGLYLAVATLIFAWMGQEFLFQASWLGVSGGSSNLPNQIIGTEGAVPSFDLTSRTVLYYVFLAIVMLVLFAAANLRDTKTGRSFFAVRGSEMAAASLGIDVMRTKLMAFAVSGLLAGLAGTMVILEQRTIVPSQFFFTVSLQYLAIAVVGGLTSLGGAIAAAIVFAGLTEVFFQFEALSGWLEVVSAGLLAFVLLVYPGGLAAAPASARRLGARLWEPLSALGSAVARPLARPVAAVASAGGRALRVVARGVRGAAQVPLALALAPFGGRGDEPEPLIHEDTQEIGVPPRKRVALADWMTAADAPATTASPQPDDPPSSNGHKDLDDLTSAAPARDDRPREQRLPLIEAQGVTVRFGGLTAVSEADLTVYENEIVGLIGPNGAGKTTLFNAILGLNQPAEGRVRIHGEDVDGKGPHERARLGVARTFQVVQLFSDLDVADNLLVATHLHNDSGLLSNIAAGRKTLLAERDARRRVDRIIELLRLEDIRHAHVSDLPFGLLRMVELGRALVTGAPVLMLDEAASGLNDSETDRLVSVVRDVRDLGVSVLLIEHDIRMVTEVSDYVYCLDRGKMIADGLPGEVRRHPDVVTAYLGGADLDDEAVEEIEEVVS